MATDFETKLHEIIEEAKQIKNGKLQEWKAARRSITSVFGDAVRVLGEGAEAKESNGNSSYLSRGEDKLEFLYDRSRHKVVRKSTRESKEQEYDPRPMTPEVVEAEVEDFVRAIFS